MTTSPRTNVVAEPLTLTHQVVCLCGSTRFLEHISAAAAAETTAGRIVVRPEVVSSAAGGTVTAEMKAMLDELHLAKIRVADEVLFIAPGGYMGPSTRRELDYSLALGKPVRVDPTQQPGLDMLAHRRRHCFVQQGVRHGSQTA